MATARAKSWRAAFLPLRDPKLALSPPLLLDALRGLFSQSKMLASAAPDLPPQEVVADTILLVELSSRERDLSADGDWNNIIGCVCRLILDMSCQMQLELKSPSLFHMINFLQRIIERSCNEAGLSQRYATISQRYATIQEDDVRLGGRNKTVEEALHLLGHVVHENGGHLSNQEVNLTLDFLLRLMSCPNFEMLPASWPTVEQEHLATNGLKNQKTENEKELETLVLVAIGNLFAGAGSVVSKDIWQLAIEALRKVMELLSSKSQLVEDSATSRYYAALLRCLHLVLSDPKGSLVEHVPGFVAALRMFFTYGLTSNLCGWRSNLCITPANVCNQVKGRCTQKLDLSTGRECIIAEKSDPGPYRPPHLRNKTRTSTHRATTSGCDSGSVQPETSGTVAFSSDSELSDSDGSLRDGDCFRSSKARIAAISSIQALCRASPKALHAQWTMLLPTHDVLNPRHYQATLMTCLLFDPVLKTRMAAASTLSAMLEGPSSVFLRVAEYKESTRPGSFTTLSSSLGQILVQLHAGLVHLVLNESHSGVLVNVFKALSLLVSVAPYSRLPAELLPNVIFSVQKRTKELISSLSDHSNIVATAVSCLGTTLSTIPPSPPVEAMLVAEVSSGFLKTQDNQALLSELFLYSQPVAHPSIRFEALQALRAAIHNYPSVMSACWDQISSIVSGVIELTHCHTSAHGTSAMFFRGSSGQNLKSADDKIVLSAVKVLDEFLRAVSGFKGVDDLLDNEPSSSSCLSASPRAVKTVSAHSTSRQTGMEGCQTYSAGKTSGSNHWVAALDVYLPQALPHSAAMVRSAALTCFAGLTSSVFFSLPDSKRTFIISSIVIAASKDEIPSVRAAACRAIGVIASFSQTSASKNSLEELVTVVVSNTHDTSASVRITASWALANICDSLRHNAVRMDAEKCATVDSHPISLLAKCALRLSKDGDKIKANGVRALGNLARFVKFMDGSSINSLNNSYIRMPLKPALNNEHDCSLLKASSEAKYFPSSSLLEMMVQTFISCVTTGNVKVQWNVCHALGNLFLNESVKLKDMTWAPSVYSILLLLLRDSSNFKIRIHAASALAVPSTREDYGDSFADVAQALGHTLETLDTDNDMTPSSFKYRKTLAEQLTSTALHIFGLALPEDHDTLKDFLIKRAVFLEEWLRSTCSTIFKVTAHANCEGIQAADRVFGKQDIEINSRDNADCLGYDFVCDEQQISSGDQSFDNFSGNEASAFLKEDLMQKKASLFKAIRALIEMYRYGNHQNWVPKFEHLTSQIS